MHRGFPICNPKMNAPIAFDSTCLAMYYFHPRSGRASQVFTNLFSCLNYQEPIKSYQMLLQVCPRDLKIFAGSINFIHKNGLKPLKTTTTACILKALPSVAPEDFKGLGPKITDLFAVKDEIQWTSMNPLSFWKCLICFLWMILESFKNHAGKMGTSKKMVYSYKPGSPKVWKQHDGTGRIGPRQPLF